MVEQGGPDEVGGRDRGISGRCKVRKRRCVDSTGDVSTGEGKLQLVSCYSRRDRTEIWYGATNREENVCGHPTCYSKDSFVFEHHL